MSLRNLDNSLSNKVAPTKLVSLSDIIEVGFPRREADLLKHFKIDLEDNLANNSRIAFVVRHISKHK